MGIQKWLDKLNKQGGGGLAHGRGTKIEKMIQHLLSLMFYYFLALIRKFQTETN